MEQKDNYTDEEKDLLATYEANEWKSVNDQQAEIKRYRYYANATFKKDKRINIRISAKNLDALQQKAIEEGIPYQTLIASVLHKYINGRLVESKKITHE